MMQKRRKYTEEFKVAAVKLITEKGYRIAEAARNLGVGIMLGEIVANRQDSEKMKNLFP